MDAVRRRWRSLICRPYRARITRRHGGTMTGHAATAPAPPHSTHAGRRIPGMITKLTTTSPLATTSATTAHNLMAPCMWVCVFVCAGCCSCSWPSVVVVAVYRPRSGRPGRARTTAPPSAAAARRCKFAAAYLPRTDFSCTRQLALARHRRRRYAILHDSDNTTQRCKFSSDLVASAWCAELQYPYRSRIRLPSDLAAAIRVKRPLAHKQPPPPPCQPETSASTRPSTPPHTHSDGRCAGALFQRG